MFKAYLAPKASLGLFALCALSFGVSQVACSSAKKENGEGDVVESTQSADVQGELKVSVSPAQIVDGSLIRVDIEVPASLKLSAKPVVKFGEKEIPVYPLSQATVQAPSSPKEGVPAAVQASILWEALAGIPLDYSKSEIELSVKVSEHAPRGALEEESTKVLAKTLKLKVGRGEYQVEKLRVDPRHVNPPKAALARIERESAELGPIYRTVTEQKLWSGKFQYPVKNPRVTSRYGIKRVYNGEPRSFHSGVDFKAGVGAPIYAPADGKVALAKDLYFTGNTVILDHGYGLFSIYAHMSKLNVKKGQTVAVGKKLGAAGSTGRVTGPHLHWGLVVHGVKVSPLEAFEVIQ